MNRVYPILCALVVLPYLLGTAGCPTKPTPDTPPAPEFTAADLVLVTDFAAHGALVSQSLLILAGDFDGCMVAGGFAQGLGAVSLYAPEIEAEVMAPDGALSFPAWEYDGTACAGLLPIDWPPTEPDPDLHAMIAPMAESTMKLVATLIEGQAPDSGEDCVRARIAAALLTSFAEQIPAILDDVMVEADLRMPIAGFAVSYGGCGE